MASRVRNVRQCTFGWIDHNLLHDGFLSRLSPESVLLYFFLCLVADRNGCSYYDYEKICSYLKLQLDQYITARDQLIGESLIAFEHGVFQVLNLPAKKYKHVNTTKDQNQQKDFQVMKQILEHVKQQ